MTAQELIEEGFERVDVYIEESGDEKDYYFYRMILSDDVVLTSDESDIVNNNKWKVHLFELHYTFKNIEQVKTFISLHLELTKQNVFR